MSRLIDADALLYVLETVPLTDDGGVDINDLEDIINRLPTIDAVEVVRCKDCKHRQKDTIFKKLYCDGREVVADGFCWKGEKR